MRTKILFRDLGIAALLLFAVFFAASCGDGGGGSTPGNGELVGDTPTGTFIFGYTEGTNEYFTQQIGSQMGKSLGMNQWDSSTHWLRLTSVTSGGRQWIVGHHDGRDEGDGNNDVWVQEIFMSGDMGFETSRSSWSNVYPNLVGFGGADGTNGYLFGQRRHENWWFVQRVNTDGTLGAQVDSGTWGHYYDVAVPMWTDYNTYIYMNTKDITWKGVDSQHMWAISKFGPDGEYNGDSDSGFWENFYPSTTAFEVGGEWYIFGLREPSKCVASVDKDCGVWFIQHVDSSGKMGSGTDSGTWVNFYKTISSFKDAQGNTYLFGLNGDPDTTKNDTHHWFIQQVLPGGKMGNQTDSGQWNDYYNPVIPFPLDNTYLPQDDWMGAMNETIGGRKLIDITLPGSHDAGVNTEDYDHSNCDVGISCNTVAQDVGILGQLKMGSRYFDIRPVVASSSGDGNSWSNWYTGHYGKLFDAEFGGCRGESMDAVFKDVNTFFADPSHRKELVILKISHCMNVATSTDTGGDCGTEHFSKLKTHIETDLQKKVTCTGCSLMDMTLDEILAKGNVIVLVDGLPSDPGNGIFSWKNGDLAIFDSYSNTESLSSMVSDQLGKLSSSANHDKKLFLLSWTLTMGEADALTCWDTGNTILDMAQPARNVLQPYIRKWVGNHTINGTIYPNILYVDSFNPAATRTAIYLNKQR